VQHSNWDGFGQIVRRDGLRRGWPEIVKVAFEEITLVCRGRDGQTETTFEFDMYRLYTIAHSKTG
jgi:hypothetical protein